MRARSALTGRRSRGQLRGTVDLLIQVDGEERRRDYESLAAFVSVRLARLCAMTAPSGVGVAMRARASVDSFYRTYYEIYPRGLPTPALGPATSWQRVSSSRPGVFSFIKVPLIPRASPKACGRSLEFQTSFSPSSPSALAPWS